MRAITAGKTFQDNMDLNLYYDDASCKFSEHGYIGLYKEKSIRAIGKLRKTVLAEEIDGKMVFERESGGEVTEKEKAKILFRRASYLILQKCLVIRKCRKQKKLPRT